MQIVQLVFLSTFNASYMCPNIRCDGVKSFWVGTKQGRSRVRDENGTEIARPTEQM
jgi:hypothetical protein